MSWTDERIALLKKMWSDGKTAAEIAKALGAGLTRNAVIGKAHRLKLSSRLSPVHAAPRRAEPANTVRVPSAPRAARTAPVIPVKINTKNVKLFDLRERMCRWPLGDPKDADFSFCGCSTIAGLPYCADHSRMAYQVSKRSRLTALDDFDGEEVDEDLIKSVVGR